MILKNILLPTTIFILGQQSNSSIRREPDRRVATKRLRNGDEFGGWRIGGVMRYLVLVAFLDICHLSCLT